MQDISGKTAIVTGAASGIGLGIATALAEAGANVVMADIQKDAVEQAAHGLSGTNKRVMPVRIDVTQEQSVLDALAEAQRNFGRLHIACNNAGVPMHGTKVVDVAREDWEFLYQVQTYHFQLSRLPLTNPPFNLPKNQSQQLARDRLQRERQYQYTTRSGHSEPDRPLQFSY